jgi:hypothetical protein
VSHPNRGLPPRDLTVGYPTAMNALGAARDRVAARALEIAVAADPTFTERYGEVELQALLADLMAIARPLGVAVASRDPLVLAHWAGLAVPRYRKRSVPMDDLIQLFEGLRRASASVVDGPAMEQVDAAIDEAIKVFRWHRRLGGDARKRNALLSFLYKGA